MAQFRLNSGMIPISLTNVSEFSSGLDYHHVMSQRLLIFITPDGKRLYHATESRIASFVL